MANSVDLDETAHYELSHLDPHCLQRYLFWSAGMKRLTKPNKNKNSMERDVKPAGACSHNFTLIQEGQLSVSGSCQFLAKESAQILINRLDDQACLGKSVVR